MTTKPVKFPYAKKKKAFTADSNRPDQQNCSYDNVTTKEQRKHF